MNDETIQYYNNLFSHQNNLPHAPQTEHIQKREIINKNQKYTKTNNGITYENTLPLIKITHGTCPECDCKTYSYDMWRGEKVCPQCGLVLEEGIAQQPYYTEIYKKHNHSLTWEEKLFLRKHGHHKYQIPAEEWNDNIDNKTIKSLAGQAQLNRHQQIELKYIIDTIGFKHLHPKANKPEIICAVIRYLMKQTYNSPSNLRYNQGIFKDLLTEDVYQIVECNLIKHLKK